MYQEKTYSVLDKYQKLDEELVESEAHTDEEQMLPRNPNNTNLSDEANDETVSSVSRQCSNGEERAKTRNKMYNDDIAMFRGKK